jgi:hypothetical protein
VPYSIKRDDCIWLKHLPPDLQLVLSGLAESESVCLKLNGHETVWCRMCSGPHGPTQGIRVTRGHEFWRSVPRGAGFSLELAAGSGAPLAVSEPAAKPEHARQKASVLDNDSRFFNEYLFADYSGAASGYGQRTSIKVAFAKAHFPATVDSGVFTRESLLDWMHRMLRDASERGVRVCLGQDHSYGFPLGLARELGIAAQPWRSGIASFLDGSYASGAPRFTGVPEFTAGINLWLRSRGFQDYFWSATQKGYGLPSRNPRVATDEAFSRVTDTRRSSFGRGSPMPFSRVGDNGSVGGQALWGLTMQRRLIALCERDGILLRCWPFDGLTVSSKNYENAHVLVEAYPSALRDAFVAQSDEADALCTVEALRMADAEGRLGPLLDVAGIPKRLQAAVRFEGWIFGQEV